MSNDEHPAAASAAALLLEHLESMSKMSDDEHPADLAGYWFDEDGTLNHYPLASPSRDVDVEPDTEVFILRTDSKRALRFIVDRGDASIDFVLDWDQVQELAIYLYRERGKLLPPGEAGRPA